MRRIRAIMGVPGPQDTASPGWVSAVAILVLLILFWTLSRVVGGAGVVPPHWFYLPIAAGAARFRYAGALVVAAAAGVLAGPLLPLQVSTGAPQSATDWVGRTGFFIALGLFVAWAIDLYREATHELRSSGGVARALMGGSRETPHPLATGERSRIRAAMAPGALEIVLHPVVSLASGEPVGYEALSRFRLDPERPPDRWFTEAWGVGLGVDLELLAVERAMGALQGLNGGFLAVNISPATVLSEQFARIAPDLPCERLVLEMTEHVPVADYEKLNEAMRPLRERGVRFAVDDAGAGYASLRHAIHLAPDIIKIDIGLVRGIDENLLLRSVARALVNFGEQSGAMVVAEGIEQETELRILQTLGVEYGQGFLFGRPAPLEDLVAGFRSSPPAGPTRSAPRSP